MKNSFKVLGAKVPLEVILLLMFMGAALSLFLFCEQWHASRREPMLSGAPLTYDMQKGVPLTWPQTTPPSKHDNQAAWYRHLETNEGGTIPPSDTSLAMLSENSEHPKCCPAAYSTSQGCVCLSAEQARFLNARGGNRVPGGLMNMSMEQKNFHGRGSIGEY